MIFLHIKTCKLYIYFNPRIKNINDGKHEKNVFSEEEMKFYTVKNYDWIGPEDISKKIGHQKRNQSTINQSDKRKNDDKKIKTVPKIQNQKN